MSTRKFLKPGVLVCLVLAALLLVSCGPATTATNVATQPPIATTVGTQPLAATTVATQPPVPTVAKAPLTPDRLVPELTFTFATAEDDPVRNEIGIMLTNEWEKLGLRVKPQPMTYDSYITILKTFKDFNIFTNGLDGRPERLDPDVLLTRCCYAPPENYEGYNNPAYNALIDAERAEMDINKRQALVFQAQEILANDLPAIALYDEDDVDAVNTRLFDNITTQPGQGTYNYWNLLSITPKTTDVTYLKVGHVELPDSLNPFYETSGAATEVMRELYDTLTRIGPDGTAKPCAAESWQFVDPLTLNVTLRQGMKFNDGTPVTAKDVKFSYDIQQTEGASIYTVFLTDITSIDVIDDYHLTFHLAAPNAPILIATFAQIYIIPEHIWSTVPSPKSDYDNSQPVGSGPFNLVYMRPGEELKADANKGYQFPPKIDGYYVVMYSNKDAAFLGLMKQEVHLPYETLNKQQEDEAAATDYLTIFKAPSHSVRYIGFNLRVPPFSDPKFRDAIGYTIDYDTIVNVFLEGNGNAGVGFIAPANTFWHDPNQKVRTYDPAKARELLAAAGYEWDAQGLMYMPAKP